LKCFGLVALACLTACSSAPPSKDWSNNSYANQQLAIKYILLGESKKSQAVIAQLRKDLSLTARTDLAAKTELILCATEQAALIMPPCENFEKLKSDAKPSELAYAQFLSGQWNTMTVQLLPEQYQALVQHAQPESQLAGIESPLSRLIAGSVLLQKNQLSANGLELMVNTASSEGWRKPLLAWLSVQLKVFEQNQDESAATLVKRRIQMLEQTLY
jgi:plasmid maintenance system killer protein